MYLHNTYISIFIIGDFGEIETNMNISYICLSENMSISSLKVFCTSNVEKVSLSISEAILWNNMNVGKTSNFKRF